MKKIKGELTAAEYEKLVKSYPRHHKALPIEYAEIYDEHYLNNREGRTKATKMSSKLEMWLHKKVARTSDKAKKTLEIGAGTLNQLSYEHVGTYDIIEPYVLLYKDKPEVKKIRNFYKDIKDVAISEKYDRIISVACFEHICNLPEVIEKCAGLLNKDGVLAVSIPNEGRFLWHFAYTMTTGREFHKKYGLDYEIMMRHEHVNTADEIEALLLHYFTSVQMSLLGVGKTFSFYRYYECRGPKFK